MQRKEIHLYDTLISPKKNLHKKSEWGKNDSCEYFFFIVERKSVYPGSILLSASGNEK